MSTDTTRPDGSKNLGMTVFVVALVVSTIALAVGLPIARSNYLDSLEAARVEREQARRAASAERNSLFVPRVIGELPVGDPGSEVWAQAPEMEVKLQRQRETMPMLETQTIETVRVRGLTDGRTIVWRLNWSDDSVDANVDSGRFSDAVGMQFPIDRNAAFTMGDRGRTVQILHWKALWQKDVDEHFQDVQDLHPNYWTDLYWFAEGRPYEIPASFKDPRSHQWFAAYSAGNPLADIYRSVPVEELAAEGFGTLTSQAESVTVGRGVHEAGTWSVVLARPLQTTDELDYQFSPGGRGSVGIAVWDGVAGNVGGRKHWTNWIEFEVSP